MDGAPDAKGRKPKRQEHRPARRAFVAGLAASFVVPRRVMAQRAPLPLIGFLNPTSPDTYSFTVVAFREGLKESGFVEGQNVQIEYRWAYSDYARLPELAKELAGKGVLAIAATGDVASARAAQAATRTIPIVFTIGADPVRFGLVSSLSRPGGNTTGVNLLSSILSGKRLELLHEAAPHIRRVALVTNPGNFAVEAERRDAEEAGKALNTEVITLHARNQGEVETVLAELVQRDAQAIITGTDPIILSRRQQIIGFAVEKGLPAIGFVREFADAGGLLSYGPSITWMYRQAGVYVGQILKGKNPAEMPVLQPTQFEFVVNLKAAERLGIQLPLAFISRADEVIE